MRAARRKGRIMVVMSDKEARSILHFCVCDTADCADRTLDDTLAAETADDMILVLASLLVKVES